MMLLWLGFVACTAAIVFSGTKISKYGDIIAEKTGLGRSLIGLILVASVTSLPELVTGISSVAFADAPDIAIGDVLGSCMFNMLILALLDAFYRPMPISTKAHYGHTLSAGFGMALLGIVAISLYHSGMIFSLGWIGINSLLILFIYLIAVKLVYSYEKKKIASFIKKSAQELKYKEIAINTAVTYYLINAVVIAAAGFLLPQIGKGIAETTGWGQTFVGTSLIALSTSLPEVVVSLAALRLGAIDLAIGALLGSNLFNIFILFVDDVFFIDGPIISFASSNHMLTVLAVIIMKAAVIIGLTYSAKEKRFFIAWDSLAIVSVYIATIILLGAGC